MKQRDFFKSLACALVAVAVALVMWSCSEDAPQSEPPIEEEYTLTVTPTFIEAPEEGVAEGVALTITTTAPSWRITAEQGVDWAYASITTGLKGSKLTRITIEANTGDERTAEFVVSAPECDDVVVVVEQAAATVEPPKDEGDFYGGELNIPDDSSLMGDKRAEEVVADLGLAWNLGNTLECPGNEYAWGNIHTTRDIIDAVKAMGFNTVRLPIAWGQYYDGKYGEWHISTEWLDRVQEIVDWCLANDMYVMINEHWDNDKLNQLKAEEREALNAEFEVMWRRIAIRFRDYDYRLIFAGTNEVNDSELTKSGGDGYTDEAFESQNMLLKTFVNTVRATGGRNAYRYLAVQAFNTNIDLLHRLEIPKDSVEGRLFVECHYYTPYPFCLMEKYEGWLGDERYMYLWDSYLPESMQSNMFYTRAQTDRDIKKFGDWCKEHGVGGLLGEFAATSRVAMAKSAGLLDEWHRSRAWWHYTVVELCVEHNICPMLWDNGDAKSVDVDGGGWINRNRKEFVYKSVLNAMLDAMQGRAFEYREE